MCQNGRLSSTKEPVAGHKYEKSIRYCDEAISKGDNRPEFGQNPENNWGFLVFINKSFT